MNRQVVPFDHNRLLKAVAAEVLEPVGLSQLGRSRTWIDDHGWWATLVAFGGSGFGRGSYLNVGVTLLWGPLGGVAFDTDVKHAWKTPMSRLETQFIEARRPDWWERDVHAFAAGAVEHLESIRRRRNDVAALRERLGSTDRFWDRYHRAIASGLLGQRDEAVRGFQSLSEEAAATGWDWMVDAASVATDLIAAVEDPRAFGMAVADLVERRRAVVKLRPIDRTELLAALV